MNIAKLLLSGLVLFALSSTVACGDKTEDTATKNISTTEELSINSNDLKTRIDEAYEQEGTKPKSDEAIIEELNSEAKTGEVDNDVDFEQTNQQTTAESNGNNETAYTNEESQEEMLARVRAAQDKLNSNKKKVKGLKGEIEVKKTKKPEKGFYSEDRKTFDKYMKDARGKKAEEKLPLLRKATKIHKELPDEDKK